MKLLSYWLGEAQRVEKSMMTSGILAGMFVWVAVPVPKLEIFGRPGFDKNIMDMILEKWLFLDVGVE